MIFVTIGTTDFDKLIRVMDYMGPGLREKVIMQIGQCSYVPKYCDYFRFKPSLEPYYSSASLIISHGGLGIITEVLERGIPLVAVEDEKQPDRHQQQILQVWSETNHLIWCRNLAELPTAIVKAKQGGLVSYHKPSCTIHQEIVAYLQSI